MTRAVDDIDYPKDAEEWWLLLNKHRNQLIDLLSYHPYYRVPHNRPITAPRAEAFSEEVRKEIAEKQEEDPGTLFLRYEQLKDIKMASLLSEVWWGMPESSSVRNESGFFILCDLCSEGHVLQPEPRLENDDVEQR